MVDFKLALGTVGKISEDAVFALRERHVGHVVLGGQGVRLPVVKHDRFLPVHRAFHVFFQVVSDPGHVHAKLEVLNLGRQHVESALCTK